MILSRSTLEALEAAVGDSPFWPSYLDPLFAGQSAVFNVHLAVFVQPYLKFVLDGRKTIESRFSANRCAPYGRVRAGDVILLKQTGGAVLGVCQAGHVWDYRLEPGALAEIQQRFGAALCAQGHEFWTSRARAAVATLIQVDHVYGTVPVPMPKRDRRGWVVLTPEGAQARGGA